MSNGAASRDAGVPLDLILAMQSRVPAWAGRPLRASVLSGGMTNHNFRVDCGDATYVLRVGGNNTGLLGIAREVEQAATAAAALAGVGPELVAYLEPEQYMVTRFLTGTPIAVQEMKRPETLRRVAAALRRFHRSAPIPGSFWSFRVVERYAETALAYGVPLPPLARSTMEAARRIEQALFAGESEREPPAAVLCPCHNDLLNANFLDVDGDIRILDWEYAGMGDPWFDLANFSSNHDFTEADDRALLAAYFETDESPSGHFARLQLMRIMSLFREAMWGVVQQGISEVDFDYAGYTDGYLRRLNAQLADARFEQWLAAARVTEGSA